MRNGWIGLAALGALVVTASCAVGAQRVAEGRTAADFHAESVLIVHYHRPDGDYRGWNLWAWVAGQEGRSYRFANEDGFGRYAVVPFQQAAERFGFLVRKGEWEAKDVDRDRFAEPNADGIAEVWVVSGDETVYTDPEAIDMTPRVSAAFLDGPSELTVALTRGVSVSALDPRRMTLRVGDGGDGDDDRHGVREIGVRRIVAAETETGYADLIALTLERAVPLEALDESMTLELPGFSPATVYARDVLETPQLHATDAELGYRYELEQTTFRAWSPVAAEAELLLYDTAAGATPRRTVPMRRGERGVWHATVAGDLHGTYYAYRFTSYGERRTVPDIYAYAASADSSRGLVLDLDRTDPPGWDAHAPPTLDRPTDEVIYEIHVRDFTVADPTCPPAWRGKYLGLTHTNAGTAQTPGTALSHLRDLGVTAAHLMPIHDFTASLDEYNWGYWTALFNVPEAQYSTSPHDPAQTIRELKRAILALHEADIRVILDVVYNHTSSSFEHSPFDQTVPWYYFRTSPDGRLLNESGTGNAIADERAMVRDYIVDSLRYWVTEYRVDGFRFDLLGMHEPETVAAIERELLAIRPDLTLYGEPWTGGGPIRFGKGAQRGSRFAVFNDHLRDALRGDLDGTARGFISGAARGEARADAVRRGVVGAIAFNEHIHDFAHEPIETVNYVSAHDNLTLWDKLARTLPDATDAEKRAMQKLALGVVLTSQGIAFLHGGSDFCRTKHGHHNSYNAGDAINAFDWQRKHEYREVHEYVRGLIALRRAHPAFRMTDAAEVRANLRFLEASPLIAYTLDGAAVGDPWAKILVAYNGDGAAHELTLPGGEWTVAVDHERAGVEPIGRARDRVTLPPHSMIVLHR